MDSLIIRQLQATPVLVPMAFPVHTASGSITQAPLLLVDILTEQGVQGHAYIFTYTPLSLKATSQLLHELAPLLKGQDCAPHALATMLEARFRLLGNTGLVAMALAAIDMAAWDTCARASGLSLVRMLGGAERPVPSYFSQGLDGVERGVKLAGECIERGFKLMKIKAGYSTLEEDLRVIKAVQGALGTQAELAVDYNQSLTMPEALRRTRALDDLGLAWIEEPTRQDDYVGHARIAQQTHTPIMIGENWFGTNEMAKALHADASDLVMPDVMKIGGVSGWMRAAALADAARVPMASHLFHEITAHLMCVTPTAHRLEYLDLAAPILQQPSQVVDGCITPNSSPGSGLLWDEQAVARYRVS